MGAVDTSPTAPASPRLADEGCSLLPGVTCWAAPGISGTRGRKRYSQGSVFTSGDFLECASGGCGAGLCPSYLFWALLVLKAAWASFPSAGCLGEQERIPQKCFRKKRQGKRGFLPSTLIWAQPPADSLNIYMSRVTSHKTLRCGRVTSR